MKITRLVRNVRDKRKISIYVDSKYTFSVFESILVRYNLFSGKEVTPELLEEIQHVANISYFKDKAIGLVARRPRSIKEIRDYLSKKTDDELSEEVINSLIQDKYLDDDEFARWWIEQRLTFNNKSVREIQNELYKKGISKDIIQNQLEKIDTKDIELEKATELIQKKLVSIARKEKDKYKQKEKLIVYLQRKGYSWETIQSALTKFDF